MEEKQRITVYMSPKTWKAFKHECLERDISASGGIDEAIRVWLENNKSIKP